VTVRVLCLALLLNYERTLVFASNRLMHVCIRVYLPICVCARARASIRACICVHARSQSEDAADRRPTYTWASAATLDRYLVERLGYNQGVCVCVRARARACVRACVRACARACVCACVFVPCCMIVQLMWCARARIHACVHACMLMHTHTHAFAR
jgi:hypothetical protein